MKVIFGLTKVSSFSATKVRWRQSEEISHGPLQRNLVYLEVIVVLCYFFVLKFIQIFSDRRGSPRAKINLMFLMIILLISAAVLLVLGVWAGCHDELRVPDTERGPAGGAVAAVSLVAGCRVLGGVGRAAADRADRDIGVHSSPANDSSAATPPPVTEVK